MDFCTLNTANERFKIARFGNSDFPFPLVSDVSMVGPTMDKSKCEEAVRKDCFAQQPFFQW